VSLSQHKNDSWRAILITFLGFALSEPIGIAIGLAISKSSELVASIIVSLAGGTFVYVACSEILVHEFAKNQNTIPKMISFIFGAAVIVCLWFLHEHE
jgi:zinc transporter ZupT